MLNWFRGGRASYGAGTDRRWHYAESSRTNTISDLEMVMEKSAYRGEHAVVGKILKAARWRAGKKKQRAVAALLGVPQSFVSKYENGGRYLDVVEFLRIAYVLDANPHKLIDEILERAPALRVLERRRPRPR